MATAVGKPPRFEGSDFSHARVELIPVALQGIDRREGITQLMAGPVVGEGNSPTSGTDCMRKLK
jgi:hypothetical protein